MLHRQSYSRLFSVTEKCGAIPHFSVVDYCSCRRARSSSSSRWAASRRFCRVCSCARRRAARIPAEILSTCSLLNETNIMMKI